MGNDLQLAKWVASFWAMTFGAIPQTPSPRRNSPPWRSTLR